MQFSIVIPTRARNDALARCLGHLLPQVEGLDAEVIVTDDGTSDDTRQMLESRFPAVRWVRGPQRGPGANRNSGSTYATGEFVLFLDDDIIPSPRLLAAYRDAIRPDSNVYEGKTICKAGLTSPLEASPVNETGGWLWSCNMMLRRSSWQVSGGFDEAFPFPHMEDVAFREYLKARGERLVFVPEAVVDHPPRRIPPAATRSRFHESHFIYHYKYLGRRPSLTQFLTDYTRYALRQVITRRKGPDTLVFLGSSCVELAMLLGRWREWDRRYRDQINEAPVSLGGRRLAGG